MARFRTFLVLLFILPGFQTGSAFSKILREHERKHEIPGLHLFTKISSPKPGRAMLLSSRVSYRLKDPLRSVCFKLRIPGDTHGDVPFQPLKHLEPFLKRKPKMPASVENQQILFNGSGSLRIRWLSESVFRLDSAQATELFTFRHRGFVRNRQEDLVLSGFYPRPLISCPDVGEKVRIQSTRITGELSAPASFHFEGPVQAAGAGRWMVQISAPDLSLILNPSKGNLTEFEHSGVRIRLITLGENPELVSGVRSVLDSHISLLGPFPYKELSIVERAWSYPPDSPGLIVFSRPDQPLFRYLQKDILNWQYWALSALISAQWFGSSVRSLPEDDWLLAGICDYAGSVFLKTYRERDNLFNYYDHEISWLSLNFRQIQDMAASLLTQSAPRSRLTSESLVTDSSPESSHPLRFIKHSVALRNLNAAMGRKSLTSFLGIIADRYRLKYLSPAEFFTEFENFAKSPSQNPRHNEILRQWWTSRGWPDYKMESLRSKKLADGSWLAHAEISGVKNFDLPFRLKITDKAGSSYFLNPRATGEGLDSRTWKASLLTDLEPVRADIDPEYHLFDSDRFNNSSVSSGLNFFPFGTNTLSDQNYTSVWVPYMFRRAGENTSVAVQMAFLRYLQSGLYLRLEASPVDRKTGATLKYQRFVKELEGNLTASISQDYIGTRSTGLVLYFLTGYAAGIRYDPGLALRYHQYPGVPAQNHPTTGAEVRLSPVWHRPVCAPVMRYSLEFAPGFSDSAFRYKRHTGVLTVLCGKENAARYTLRLFQGVVKNDGIEVPDSVNFRANDQKEAGVRIDSSGIPLAGSFSSLKQEADIPLNFPYFLDFLHLSHRARLKLFYDFGFPERVRPAFYESAGIGLELPLGGDIMGMGTLTLSRVSVLGIFYSRKNRQIHRRPQVLFDITGEL